MNKKRFLIATLMAWFVFITIDFIMHASILAPIWLEQKSALKPLTDLAALIPAGYTSFFLLTFLVGWMFVHLYREDPGTHKAMKFSLIFGSLFAISNFLSVYSYINLPVIDLLLFNLVYFIEIIAVVAVFEHLLYAKIIKKRVRNIFLMCFGGLVTGIVLQNAMQMY